MEIKRGSVTPVDLTGQADGDYIRNDGGVYKPKSIADNLIADYNAGDVFEIFDVRGLADFTFTGGTGSVSSEYVRTIELRTGATAGSTVEVLTTGLALIRGGTTARMNWAKYTVVYFRVNQTSASTNSIRHWNFGGRHPVTDENVVGLKAAGTALYGYIHNSPTVTEVDLGVSIGTTPLDCVIVSHNGNVEWYIDGVSRGSSALGPTTNTNKDLGRITMYITNGADTVDQRCALHAAQLYIKN